MSLQGFSAVRRNRGFTLIEVMMVVVIVAILTAIAVPAYQKSVKKSHRAAAQSQMLDIANREQQYLVANRIYTSTLSDIGYTVPADVASRYTCSVNAPALTNLAPVPSFTVSCVPTALQAESGFGTLTLTNTGVKSPAGEW